MNASIGRRLGLCVALLGSLAARPVAARSQIHDLTGPADAGDVYRIDERPIAEHDASSDPTDNASSPLDAWLMPYGDTDADAWCDRFVGASEPYIGSARVPTSWDWWAHELSAGRRFRFADPRRFVLLRRYVRAGREHFRPAASRWAKLLDPERFALVPSLTWRFALSPFEHADNSGPLSAVAPLAARAIKQRKCPAWARPRPIVVTSWGSDWDRLTLVDCEGNIDVDALDRISALARIMGQQRPALPLPDEPNPPEAWPDEWTDGVRLLHPRLLWILQRIGEAYPRHTIHLMSGYRRDTRDSSPHRMGRALDIKVRGVSNEDLFAYCRSLHDVGCGYYPYHPFVHFDVRPFGSPKTYWVDASRPGERSEYVDSWPGVVDRGALASAERE